MGGYDKNIPFDILADDVCKRARGVFLCGNTKQKIFDAISASANFDEKTHLCLCESFDEAVLSAHEFAKSGDIVILTPACASFDFFRNFEERGKHFKNLVLGL
jgi:UDP-N-acetylmuramoylalanine--D-glutamate ligase